MSPSLRKIPGSAPRLGAYEAIGSLVGISSGRREVKWLTVRRLDGSGGETLAPLAAFRQLERLQLDDVSHVDLRPLAGLQLDILELWHTEAIDVSALDELSSLRLLGIRDARNWVVPRPLRLPASLRGLALGNDGADQTGDDIKALIEAIEWRSVPYLESLSIAVGGLHVLAPIHVDLGFLRCLPALTQLDIPQGVWHTGPGPSPLEPPFDGLSQRLGWVRIDADDAERVKAALEERVGEPVSVYQREPLVPQPEWTIDPPEDAIEVWHTYGSLYDVIGGGVVGEYEACQAAEARVRAADPDLADRLDFDQESSGTGIAAPTREDLERALRLIGIPPRT